MNKNEWEKAETELSILFDLDAQERKKYLKKLSTDNPTLFQEVNELWNYIEESESFLSNSAIDNYRTIISEMIDSNIDLTKPRMEGRIIGKYQIVHKLGHGGMGNVYLAKRVDGDFNKEVAIKFLRIGINQDSILARFKQEQQIHAKLNHPSIPALYDADVDEQGTPYIIMEYVKGKSLSSYLRESKPSLNERLKLFVQICQVIHFAHQNLVIHRDLKPSNILITDEGNCKLLDFGISKLLEEEIDSGLTKTNAQFFSVKYAAPEQVQGNAITTATDIYALGMILHELVCDFLPYETDTNSILEVEHTICNKPITKPSAKVLQQNNDVLSREDKIKLSRILKGDLDNIILKSLEKDPLRRYASAKEFSEDLERYLNNRPVLARPAGFIYSINKFVRRNKMTVATSFFFFITLLSGFIYHSVTVTIERNTAELQAKKFEQISEFLIYLFEYDDLTIPPEEATIANLLDAGVSSIDEKLSSDPEVQAEIMLTIGNSYLQLGEILSGFEMVSRATEIYERLPLTNTLSKSRVYLYLANAYYENGHSDSFIKIDQAIEIAKQEHGYYSKEYSEALWLKGKAIYRAEGGESMEAEEIMDRYLDIISNVFPKNSPEYGVAVSEHAAYRFDLNERLEALKKAIKVNEQIHGKNSPSVANILNTLGFYYRSTDVDQSIIYFNEAIDIYENLYGDAHFRTINSLTNLGDTYLKTGDMDKSIITFQRAVNAAKSVYPAGSIRIADPLYWLSNAQIQTGSLNIAEQNLIEVLTVYEKNYEAGSLKVEMARSNLGYAIRLQGRDTEGTLLIKQTLENVRRVHGNNHRLIDFANSRL